jgi:hypothetical protein
MLIYLTSRKLEERFTISFFQFFSVSPVKLPGFGFNCPGQNGLVVLHTVSREPCSRSVGAASRLHFLELKECSLLTMLRGARRV